LLGIATDRGNKLNQFQEEANPPPAQTLQIIHSWEPGLLDHTIIVQCRESLLLPGGDAREILRPYCIETKKEELLGSPSFPNLELREEMRRLVAPLRFIGGCGRCR